MPCSLDIDGQNFLTVCVFFCSLSLSLSLSSDKGDKWRVFYHFVGAVPGSSSLEQMLKRLLREMGMSKQVN